MVRWRVSEKWGLMAEEQCVRTDVNLQEGPGLRRMIHCSSSKRTLDRVGPESRLRSVQRKNSTSEEDFRQQRNFLDSH